MNKMQKNIVVCLATLMIAFAAYAEEEDPVPAAAQQNDGSSTNQTKGPKGVDLVTDAAAAAVTKAKALLSMDLEITMAPDNEKYKNKNNYTINAIGEKTPKSTMKKTGKALY